MALFSFADIRFANKSRNGIGPNEPLLSGKSEYKVKRYPIDLGAADKGHYLVIHINEQRRTQFKGTQASEEPTVIANRRNIVNPTLSGAVSGLFSTVNNLIRANGVDTTSISNEIGKAVSSDSSTKDEFEFGFTRTIKRTTETIALYMPDTLNFVYNQAYSDSLSLGGTKAAALITGAASAADAFKNGGLNLDNLVQSVKNISPFVASYLAQQNDLTRVGFAAITGTVQNPMMEMIYSSPTFREFRFDFMLYPRSEQESIEVQQILQSLRFHQAPEILKEGKGFFLVPPSEFDIKFYYNGRENLNIPKISTCVLTSMDVDYAPNGFATYEVPYSTVPREGETGMPVAIRLSLNFKETEYLTKEHHKIKSMDISSYSDIFQRPGEGI